MIGRRRWPLVTTIAIGVALVLSPVVFQMFTRAPRGGVMIKGFAPYMTTHTIATFRGDLAIIGSAANEVTALHGRIPAADQGVATFQQQWPGIHADMGAMLSTMAANLAHYRGVAALPPFVLFPWFFVIPGLLVIALAVLALRAPPASPRLSRWRIALVVLGVGIIAAPALFQMFSRAPGGAKMISAFRPLMTTAKVTRIQGYFLTIGDGEGDLRLKVVPQLTAAGVPAREVAAITTFDEEWPTIASTMAPMIGAMSDNVGNFAAVKALPPFWLFPWFFVVPGVVVLVLVLAGSASPRRRPAATTLALALALVVLASCSAGTKSPSGTTLAGLFAIEAGSCAAGSPSGSYFKMVQSGGTVALGPFVANPDSTCTNQVTTLLSPGSDGGLRTGRYQPEPPTPFAAKGNSAAVSVIQPQAFFAVLFGVSTNPTDPQTGRHVPAPSVTESGDQLRADLSAWSVSWNGQQFNQGSPKPGTKGSTATGTYDATSGVYTLEWTSLIKGGPFNGFTGIWHLAGMFEHS